MNILFDSYSTQVLYQVNPSGEPSSPIKATGLRLNTILGAMQSIGSSSGDLWKVTYSTKPITSEMLADIDVYVSFTRYPTEDYAYKQSELDALTKFVKNGGGILLMTNHGAFPGQTLNWSTNDNELAKCFGIKLEPDAVYLKSVPLTVNSTIGYLSNQAAAIVSHDSCVIMPPKEFVSLVEFPAESKTWDAKSQTYIKPPSDYFSILVNHGSGNVIVTGNSGMFTDYGTPHPSCGLVTMENNLMYFLNCVGYLGGWRNIPAAGQCPGS